MNMKDMDETEKASFLSYHGGKNMNDQVVYTDLTGTVSKLSGGIMGGITILLIASAAISLVVSLIMIPLLPTPVNWNA